MEQGNTTALLPVNRSMGLQDKSQIQTEDVCEGTELTFEVGWEISLEKEKKLGESHPPPPRGMQEPSAQKYPQLESQSNTFSMQSSSTHSKGK